MVGEERQEVQDTQIYTVRSKESERAEIARQTREFMAAGGKVKQLDYLVCGSVGELISKATNATRQVAASGTHQERYIMARRAFNKLRGEDPGLTQKDAAALIAPMLEKNGFKLSVKTIRRYLVGM